MADKLPKLTPKQQEFANGILEGKSGTQAAVDAYNVKNRKTASVIAAENLAKPSIEEYLQTLWYKARSFLETVLDGDEIQWKTPNIKTRVDVAKFLDDKATGKAQGKMDVTSNGQSIVVEMVNYWSKQNGWQQ